MRIDVYVREKVFSISCGVGGQRVRWLAQSAVLRYDGNGMLKTGQPKLVKLEDGSFLGMNERISDRLVDNARVWVLFEDVRESPQKKKQIKKK